MKRIVTLLLAICLVAALAVPTLGEGEMLGNMYLTGTPIVKEPVVYDIVANIQGNEVDPATVPHTVALNEITGVSFNWTVLTNAETLTGNLSQLDLDATMKKVDVTLENVKQLTATLNSNQGTVGKLLNDANLYNHVNATMRDLDSLLVDFKQHPRRYINVSVFGKKDK